ncbi:MAG TPA: CbtA family protein [Solirubrobacteraceae bacterium]|nr:CbtA family protein [Solirubrobacteraceae bacterium]
MLRNLLICGLIAGACAGLFATGFAELAGEPSIDRAISFEARQSEAAGEAPEPELVSRDVQRTAGLVTGAVVYGLALGGLFALAFGYVYGRVARTSPRRTALWLAASAFAVLFLVPFVKYPANPPGIGGHDTIGHRTLLQLTMVAISLLAAIAAVRLHRAASARVAPAGAAAIAGAVYVAVVVVAGLALPAVHEVPRAFPATTLWEFRQASVGMNAVLWATIGLLFAAAVPRVMARRPVLRRSAASSGR